MKRIIMLALAALGMSPFCGQANLLLNPGFEQASDTSSSGGVTDWTLWGGVGQECWAAETGNYGFAMCSWISRSGGACQSLTIQEEATYIFTARGRCDSDFVLSNAVEARMEFTDPSGTVLQSTTLFVPHSRFWTDNTIEVDAPIGATRLKVSITFNTSETTNGAYMWDNLSLICPTAGSETNAPPSDNLQNGFEAIQTDISSTANETMFIDTGIETANRYCCKAELAQQESPVYPTYTP